MCWHLLLSLFNLHREDNIYKILTSKLSGVINTHFRAYWDIEIFLQSLYSTPTAALSAREDDLHIPMQNVCSSKNSSNFTRGSFVPESENVCLIEHETYLQQKSYVISPGILRQVTGKEQILTFRSINYCRKMYCITPGSKGKEQDLQNSCFLGPIFLTRYYSLRNSVKFHFD